MLRLSTKPTFVSLLALGTLLFALNGCSSSGPVAHGGLVPDIDVPSSVLAGEANSYSFSASSAQGYKISYGVNWGDSTKNPFVGVNISSGSDVSSDHVYSYPGTYTITVTATDGHGESGFGKAVVVVAPPPPPEPKS